MAKGTPKKIAKIEDLTPDPSNVNKGSERGHQVIDWSLTELGAGRSILADADGVVLAGNKTLEVAADHGLPVRVVETDGRELVVVQRTDLRLQGDGDERTKARQIAIADNRSSEVGYVADMEILLEHARSVDVSPMYSEGEINALLAGFTPNDLPETSLKDLSGRLNTDYRVEVHCVSEDHQERIYKQLIEMGFQCRVLTL